MCNNGNIDMVVIGHTVIDDITFNGNNDILPGGSGPAVATSAADNGSKVGLLTKIGFDFPKRWFDVLEKKIDVSGISILDKESTTRISMVYSDDGNIEDIKMSLNASSNFKDILFPECYRHAGFVHICPLPISDQLELTKRCPNDSIISVDFNHVYENEYKNDPRNVERIVKNSDVIFPNEFEVRMISGEDDIDECVKILYDMGPSLVIVKLGSKGAMLYDGGTLKLYPSQNVCNVVDPTGCGDAFIGGFASTYIGSGDIDKSMNMANLSAAKKIMKKGSWMV